ncbi:DUF4861 family protein [Neptunitalea lumnitzerae]|uniref:DUF4861 domain-containing protein n=1 Tax=Neptunitalea lumnitzerae TaxID=2965509 RepID=A0ABQ5MMN7_9FLAO|nr:DUF4861 family protein [Neptunitalea sp. Y10]GLB50360.1 hypothetical protein Y10_27280 [Neptunitalea sp. Y10]
MFLKYYIKPIALLCLVSVIGCTATKKEADAVTVEVINELHFNRTEIVSVSIEELQKQFSSFNEDAIRVKKQGTDNFLTTQWLDNDQDGSNDVLLFQATVKAEESVYYTIVMDSTVTTPKSDVVAYSRFVPERTDDYTWENDKVAFRTYGPDAQLRVEEGRENGTLSSGIDLWLKRTDKSVIDSWYKGYQTDPMYYHHDRGEGYDPYHVGASRGDGGIGVWENDTLYVSKNFISYKTIASGPLRTVFELSYAPWSPYNIQETKRISLDLGSNFSKFQISLKAEKEVPNYAIGITTHENVGEYKLQAKKGWIRNWEQIDDAHVGEGIVMNPKEIDSAFARVTKVKDQSNLLIVAKPTTTLEYYAGFAWEKSGQVKSVADWDALLQRQKQIIENPLIVNTRKKNVTTK